MNRNKQQLPLYMAKLISGFLSHSLTQSENNELLELVSTSHENLAAFEELSDMAYRPAIQGDEDSVCWKQVTRLKHRGSLN